LKNVEVNDEWVIEGDERGVFFDGRLSFLVDNGTIIEIQEGCCMFILNTSIQLEEMAQFERMPPNCQQQPLVNVGEKRWE